MGAQLTRTRLRGTLARLQLFARISPGPSDPSYYSQVNFIRANLSPGGDGATAPISDLSDELCASVNGLMIFRHYLTKEDVARFPLLKVVVRMGVGYDRLDRVALAERDITVCNVPDYGTNE